MNYYSYSTTCSGTPTPTAVVFVVDGSCNYLAENELSVVVVVIVIVVVIVVVVVVLVVVLFF